MTSNHNYPIKDFNEYYMHVAIAVRMRANCKGRKVGAVLVKENRIISTGYNGTPEGYKNCLDGGCARCNKRDKLKGQYDICICVHAEQNALITAARFGLATAGATIYSTIRPCFNCTKELLQAGIKKVYYLYELGAPHPDPDIHNMYEEIQDKFDIIKKMEVHDPYKKWAMGK